MIITTNTTDMPDANKVMVARVCVQHHSFVAIKILKDVNVFHGFSLPLPVDRPLFFVPIIYPQFNRVIHQDKKIVLSCCSQNKNTSGPHALAVVPVRQGNCQAPGNHPHGLVLPGCCARFGHPLPVAGAYAMRYFHLNAWPAACLVGALVLLGALTHLVLDACTPGQAIGAA